MTDVSIWDGQITRCSQRLALVVPIHIDYFIGNLGRLATDTVTLVVSAHGALLRLPWGLPQGQRLRLQNLATRETREATVTYVEAAADGSFNVGVAFTQPNPEFWGVSFPPEDWSPSHPDAKQDP